MASRSSFSWHCLITSPLLFTLLFLFIATFSSAQNPVDPDQSYAEALCEFNLITMYNGTGDPLGDLGIIVSCYDAAGLPLEGIPGTAFRIENLDGSLVAYGTPVLSALATDEEGRIFLTAPLIASATLVHGHIAVVVSVGGEDVSIDNGDGIPVEFRTPDLNFDADIGIADVTLFTESWYASGDNELHLRADYDGDGDVSLADQVIFSRYFWGAKAHDVQAVTRAPSKVSEIFIGCIQRDFDDDDDPTTLRDEITTDHTGIFTLRLLARDYACISGAEVEMFCPPTVARLGAPTALGPFRDLRETAPTTDQTHFTVTAPDITVGPEFICQILMQGLPYVTYHTGDFVFGDVVYTNCTYPPQEADACIGTPTPCDLSSVSQGDDQFISCPGADLDLNDTLTVTMRDQDGAPVPGLAAEDFRVTLYDTRGSGRGDVFKMTPVGAVTDVNGELDFLFEPRAICRWPDACLALQINLLYGGCSLDAYKTVQTLNVVPYDPADGMSDLIDDDDLDIFDAAKFTADFCLDLTREYRCPVVTQASLDLVADHYLHGCNVTGVNDVPGRTTVRLSQNQPNPFNPLTEIQLSLPAATTQAALTVYDLSGTVVRRLWDGPLPQGISRFIWNGRDAGQRTVASGVYVARLETLGETRAIRMVLLR